MISKASSVSINSSQSNPSDQTPTASFPSSSELTGNTLPGPRFHSVSSPKTRRTSKLVITKPIQGHLLDAILEKIFTFYCLSEPISEERILNSPLSFTDSKLLPNNSQETTHLLRFKSLIMKLMLQELPLQFQ